MSLVFKVAENVYLIDTLGANFDKTVASYLVKGSKVALIDVGYASSYINVIKGLQILNIDLKDINYIIPTHVHLDHAGAVGVLAKYMKNAKIIAHERAIRHIIDPSKLIQSATSVYGEELMKIYGAPEPVEQDRVEAVKDELFLNLGNNVELRLIYTPGHAPHHISVIDETRKILFSGDALGIIYPHFPVLIPTMPPPSFDFNMALKSIDVLESFKPKSVLIPHFGAIINDEHIFKKNKDTMSEWLRLISEMRSQGLTQNDAVSFLTTKVSKEINTEIPIYAIGSITITVMGVYNYLDRISQKSETK
ncbi:MAG: MBL fold metallo-hydrolase [Thermoprotei archaeon]|jgi:glyoxylase-like metal-dependent hydrolase (beta-lactamase superfamily II)